jgi:hypothetical protein
MAGTVEAAFSPVSEVNNIQMGTRELFFGHVVLLCIRCQVSLWTVSEVIKITRLVERLGAEPNALLRANDGQAAQSNARVPSFERSSPNYGVSPVQARIAEPASVVVW